MQKENKKQTKNIINAPIHRRLGAFLVDFIAVIILTFIVNATLDAVFNVTPLSKSFDKQRHELQVQTHLYLDSSIGLQRFEDTITPEKEELYLDSVYYFYNLAYSQTYNAKIFNYEKSTFHIEFVPFNYKEMVLNNEQFELVGSSEESGIESYRFKKEVDEQTRNEVWLNIYNKAISTFTSSELYTRANLPFTISLFSIIGISVLISALVVYLLFALMFKNGQTMGKVVTGLVVVNKDGYLVSTKQVVIRYLVLAILELALSVPLVTIPLFITSGTMSITRNNRSLHDLFSKTRVVDGRASKVFISREEEEIYEQTTTKEQENKTIKYLTLPPKK